MRSPARGDRVVGRIGRELHYGVVTETMDADDGEIRQIMDRRKLESRIAHEKEIVAVLEAMIEERDQKIAKLQAQLQKARSALGAMKKLRSAK